MNDHIDRLEAIAHEHGYEYTAKVDIATECAWGAEVRLEQLNDDKYTGRAIVFTAGGGQEPAHVLAQATTDALQWLNAGGWA